MSENKKPRPFFVGYGKKLPKGIAKLVLPVFALFIAVFVCLSLLLSSMQGDPGDGRFRGDLGRQNLTGIVEFHPYPVLRLPSVDGEAARTLMMSGIGKRGVIERASSLDGQIVSASGIFIKRGDITMLQVRGGKRGLDAASEVLQDGFVPSEPVSLGKWRLSGEICDGKCYAGAMRPGTGLAHKACANLCISGGIPAVFVSAGEVDGSNYFLLADSDGNPLGEEMSDLVALYIEAEGEVERLDDLTIFKMDMSTVKVVR